MQFRRMKWATLFSLMLVAGCSGGGAGVSPIPVNNDKIAPSVPTGLVATAAATNQINLSWTASTDNVGVVGYDVYRDGSFVKSVAGTTTNDTAALSASTRYCYTVKAYDAAYNHSSDSIQACASTLNPSGWSSAIKLGDSVERVSSSEIDFPHVALNDSNAAIAVWDDRLSGPGYIWGNIYKNGSWGTPVSISGNLTSSLEPSVAIDANGNGAVVWSLWTSMGETIWASLYTAATNSWSTPVRICEDPGTGYSYATTPKVAMDSSGNVLAIWNQSGDIWTSRYNGTSWSNPELLSSGTNYVYSAELAIGGDNNAFVVYAEETNPGSSILNIYARLYTTATSTWGTSSTLISKPAVSTDDAGNPQISVNANGDAVVAWEASHYNGSSYEYSIAANFYKKSLLSWQTATNVTVDVAQVKSFPAVAIDGTGNAFVGWLQSSPAQAWMNRYDAGAKTWGAAQRFDTDSTWYTTSDIAIGFDGNGNALFAWLQGKVHTSWYMAASGWAPTVLLPVPDQYESVSDYSLDVNSTGNAVVVSSELTYDPWTGELYAPYANHYTKP